MSASGIPVIRYTTPERIYEIIAGYESCGIMIANPHVVTLEDGSRYKRVDADQLGFKQQVDPMGLLNPGKAVRCSGSTASPIPSPTASPPSPMSA
jgi:hypothetical protein